MTAKRGEHMRQKVLFALFAAAAALALASCAAKASWMPLFDSPDPNRTPGIIIGETEGIVPVETEDPDRLFKTDAESMDSPRVVAYKSRHIVELWDGNSLMARMAAAFGIHEGPKTRSGDGKTPEGTYYICKTSGEGRYHKSLFFSYPNADDAYNALQDDDITQEQYDDISTAIDQGAIPPWKTKLGGEIAVSGTGTMGKGKTGDWTAGNVVLADEDIDYLWKFADIGVEVEINP